MSYYIQTAFLMHDFGKCNFIPSVSPSLEENKIFCPITSVDGKRFRRNLVVMGKLNRPESAVLWDGLNRSTLTYPEFGRL